MVYEDLPTTKESRTLSRKLLSGEFLFDRMDHDTKLKLASELNLPPGFKILDARALHEYGNNRTRSVDGSIAATEDEAATSGWRKGMPCYLIDQNLLGCGGFASVHLEFNVKMNRPIAIKILHTHLVEPHRCQAFVTESRVLAKLKHHGLPEVSNVISDERGSIYIMMELLGDEYTDASEIDKNNREEFMRVLPEVIQNIGEVLDSIHEQKLEVSI